MNWEEIVSKQSNDYKEYLNGYKQGLEQLNQDKAVLLQHMNCKESELPLELKDKLNRDNETWKQEWGMYGSRFKNMRISHQKEVDKFFYKNELVKDMQDSQEKQHDKTRSSKR